ncbi:phosphoenolpyruvate carboxykinase [Clostridium manihotivorum]|uniref:Phosphoenolpyruvate carboxykinase n=1 Tax=Clostridium manihotivorum TaxID=2320868 RepID=A0A3R5U7I1_9CLOT|nr:phosphoenolpyruvate carboxykinase [Clostridium manihotivorum]QAA33858.1 phosphoenolpyruvate carboxykinase [Clostridium manihotivorum]
MRKEFSMSNDKVTINFTEKYCSNYESLLQSYGFRRVLDTFFKKAQARNSHSYKILSQKLGTTDIKEISKALVRSFQLLTIMSADEIISYNEDVEKILEDREGFISIIEDIYSFWRRLERYTIIHNNRIRDGIASVSFLEANSQFSMLILNFYRTIEKNVVGTMPNIFRQLPAGGNACILINNPVWTVPEEYKALEEIPFIETIALETPFITYPKKNTRDGMFNEVYENPLVNAKIDKDNWFCYPAKIGELLAFVYFHRDFMEHGITLSNLFELAREEEYRGKKPDIVYTFGAEEEEGSELKTVFYEDKKYDIMFGYVNYNENIDYFGYMKKMCLTLHNLIMIKRGYLPIHGAMVNIVLKNGKNANVVIIGDSGAGKSESLEAFRALSEDHVSEMTVVFDDMGSFKLKEDGIYGYGTEVGAFVRLDDLDQGYAFKEIDRSIFMNPDKINARLVMPVSTYKEIIKGYKVDILLYANNYETVGEGGKAIELFETPSQAIDIFKAGARMAKGTTTETGLVTSYFANPFGPAQKQAETDVLIDRYFNRSFEDKIKVGQIKTCLAVAGLEKNGPKNAALELFDLIKTL